MSNPKWKSGEYEYGRKLPHYQRAFQGLFINFSTKNGIWLSDSTKQVVFDACRSNDGRLMDLHALAVMSTHVHFLCHMRFDSERKLIPMRKLTHSIKSYSAHEINKLLGTSGPVWKDESFDHVIRDENSFQEKLLYIRMNPVKAGLVKRAEDYKWFWQSAWCGGTGETPVRTRKKKTDDE